MMSNHAENNEDNAWMKSLRLLEKPAVQLLIICLLALACYANSFRVPFIFDDEEFITSNEVVHSLANFFTNLSGYEYHPNRFITFLSFALNYHFGGMNPAGYHAVNLAIHIGNALLVFWLVRLTLRTPYFWDRTQLGLKGPGAGDQGRDASQCASPVHPSPFTLHPSLVPLLAALVFVIHPVQTQAVTYIYQRLASLATLFYLAALVLHIRWRLAREAGAPFASQSVLPFWLLSLAAAVLAMKTKELAITLPLVVLLYEVSFFGRPRLRLFAELAPMLLTICIIPLTMINLDKPVGKILSDVSSVTVVQTSLPRWEYLCTQFSVIVTYFRLLLFPVNQNLDYDFPISHSLLEPRAFLSLALLLAILGLAVWLYRKSGKKEQGSDSFTIHHSPFTGFLRLAAFGICWFFITLSVESSVIPIVDVMFEHRVYLPSVGFFIAVAALAAAGLRTWGARSPMAGKMTLTALVAVILLLAGATIARNNVWRSWETLWQDVKRKSPMKARAYNNLGAYYVRQERPAEAITEFEMAVEINPQYLDSLYNLAMLYVWAGRFSEAKRISDRLQKLDPETFRTLDAIYGNK